MLRVHRGGLCGLAHVSMQLVVGMDFEAEMTYFLNVSQKQQHLLARLPPFEG